MDEQIITAIFIAIMSICVSYALKITSGMFLKKKFSRLRVAQDLKISNPMHKPKTVALNVLIMAKNNSNVFSFYYYWLLFGEISTYLFLFGTLILIFFGILTIILKAQDFTGTTTTVLIILEIVITVLAAFSRSVCHGKAKELSVNMSNHW